MSVYTHENITLSVTTIDTDMTGDTFLTVHSDFIAELLKNCCLFDEFFTNYQMEQLFLEMEKDKENFITYFAEIDEDIIVQHPDAIIAIYEYCLDQDKNFEFDVETENISWVIHDMLHATHDTGGCTIYVESDIERDRIITSLEITKEQYPNEFPDFSFLENLEDEFYQRFNRILDLEDFKYNLFEEEYY